MKKQYLASISKNQGKKSFSIIFSHPLKTAPDKKSGKRVRRGLGTTDIQKAMELVEKMNILLSNEKYWSPAMKDKAQKEFGEVVASAFYDGLTQQNRNTWEEREKIIPLPGRTEGYSRTLLIGTTGAGKTTLLRQLINTDPISERFPSASASRTTACDIEIITNNEPLYRAVVSFISIDKVRSLIEESFVNAMMSYADKRDNEEFERKFTEHPELRFRLSYLLGTTKSLNNEPDELVDGDDLDIISTDLEENERIILNTKLSNYLQFLKTKAIQINDKTAKSLELDFNTASKSDLESFNELLEDEIYTDEDFQQFVDEILDEVQSKFDLLLDGELTKDRDWPLYWRYESADRKKFIERLNYFTGNFAPHFGKLLTPLVDGIRVSGQFMPKYSKKVPNLVIMDGEGLGHTPKSFSSLSTNLTAKFKLVDSIVLVDNAAQPMQATTTAALRHLVSSGQESKVSICFTHFDQVEGPNIPSNSLKINHLYRTVEMALTSIGEELDKRAEKILRDALINNIFYLSNINKELIDNMKFTINQMSLLISSIKSKILPKNISEVHPYYDLTNLTLSLKSGLDDFHKPWRAKIGLSAWLNTEPEHWTRIKALTRRLGEWGINEYQGLKPIADLIRSIRERVYRFVSRPLEFEPLSTSEEMQNQAIGNIMNEIDQALHLYVEKILLNDKIPSWYRAYSEFKGKGSTLLRSQEIKIIFDTTVPIPDEIPSIDSNKFINELMLLIAESIQKGGGRFKKQIGS